MAAEPKQDEERREEWRRLGRYLLFVVVLFSVIVGGLFSYTRTWPPMVAVESGSMQHANETSSIGVIDTGDLILVQAVSSRSDITTYLEGRASEFSTYGDYGDVIVFRDPSEPRSLPIIHRAIAFVRWNASANGYDVPDLARLPAADWTAWDVARRPTTQPFGLAGFLLHRAGWKQDLDIAFDLTRIAVRVSDEGFLTMGDNNAYTTLTKFDLWVVPLFEILGRARGEIPWFGLLKLTLFPEDAGCCAGWGSTDPERGAPANSWVALEISLAFLFGTPIALTVADLYLDRHPELRRKIQSIWRRIWRRKRSKESDSQDESREKRD